MKQQRDDFYYDIIPKRILSKDASILVCGGGMLDKEVFTSYGYKNVTISNLDIRFKSDDFSPYDYMHEDVQNLSFEDSSFDYVVIHAAIHHASMPHKTLLEMYRVSKIGVLAFESRDSFVMKLIIKLNLSPAYEHFAVYYNDCKYGGVDNTEIPNYIYRWTEREVIKTIQSYAPQHKHFFKFDYASVYPCAPDLELNNSLKVIFLRLIKPFYIIFSKICYKQQNQFAIFIEKPQNDKDLYPWLKRDSISNRIGFNKVWGQQRYK